MLPAWIASDGERFIYQRYRPEQTRLYQFVERHFDEFQSLFATQGTPLECYVQTGFETFIKCGRQEYVCLRLQCKCCHHERLVAFNCKNAVFAQSVVPNG